MWIAPRCALPSFWTAPPMVRRRARVMPSRKASGSIQRKLDRFATVAGGQGSQNPPGIIRKKMDRAVGKEPVGAAAVQAPKVVGAAGIIQLAGTVSAGGRTGIAKRQ